MKVGTDGVLLGAWAEGGRRILDIGTGSGVIALMMAQRCPEAEIMAIDIDEASASQAAENFAASPFANRLTALCCSLQEFHEQAEFSFDSIVSNPPYFENSLKNPDERKAQARHSDSLPFPTLLSAASQLLASDGVFSVVLPVEVESDFEMEATMKGLFLWRKVSLKTTPRKPLRRMLLSFTKQRPTTLETSTECLMNPDGSRSEWYKEITKEFYLFET